MRMKGIEIKTSDVRRFERFFLRESDCWEWQGYRDKDGYGTIKMSDDTFLAHRVAWAIDNGIDPQNRQVLHHCDNPPCVRPDHLFLGDHVTNMADMRAKGRAAKGERQGKTTLTESQVLKMRALRDQGFTYDELAQQFKVCYATAHNIVNRVFWRHI